MTLVTDQLVLDTLCNELASEDYITVDTEFLRDKLYYPQLCLVQVAGASGSYAVDPLAKDINLTPLFELFQNEAVLKVFHACRQDIEIILKLSGDVPKPLFDTQVAAMVCGFGDAVSYARLVSDIVGKSIDKSSRFTDWSRRPLSNNQIDYALSDVIYLRPVYKALNATLEQEKRHSWLAEEMQTLTSKESYEVDVTNLWRKLNSKSNSQTFLGVLRELTIWREQQAQTFNKPRQHVMRDQLLLEIAAVCPKTEEQLKTLKGVGKGSRLQEILDAIGRALALPKDALPTLPKKRKKDLSNKPLIDLLKVLLSIKCDSHHVAAKLVASSDDLLLLAKEEKPDIAAMHGWRFEVFGKDALALKEGKIALSAKGTATQIVSTS